MHNLCSFKIYFFHFAGTFLTIFCSSQLEFKTFSCSERERDAFSKRVTLGLSSFARIQQSTLLCLLLGFHTCVYCVQLVSMLCMHGTKILRLVVSYLLTHTLAQLVLLAVLLVFKLVTYIYLPNLGLLDFQPFFT